MAKLTNWKKREIQNLNKELSNHQEKVDELNWLLSQENKKVSLVKDQLAAIETD